MKHEEGHSKTPLLALLHLGKLKAWRARLRRASGEPAPAAQPGDSAGSGALAPPAQPQFGLAERAFLLKLARRALENVAVGNELPSVSDVPAGVTAERACFVTLTKAGELRGCIGQLVPRCALFQAVMENTKNAALRDPRFAPVQAHEVPLIHIQISVLTEPQPLSFTSPEDLLDKLQPTLDGVLLRIGGRSATFLPQVWAHVPDKVQFLNHLAQKAGCSASAWRDEDTEVSVYHAECFEEAMPGGSEGWRD